MTPLRILIGVCIVALAIAGVVAYFASVAAGIVVGIVLAIAIAVASRIIYLRTCEAGERLYRLTIN